MNEATLKKTVTVTNPQGLHARPANSFVKLANQYQSTIQVVKQDQRVDGKSILEILTLAAEQGAPLLIEATGCDAQAALDALVQLIDQGFAEEETLDKQERGGNGDTG